MNWCLFFTPSRPKRLYQGDEREGMCNTNTKTTKRRIKKQQKTTTTTTTTTTKTTTIIIIIMMIMVIIIIIMYSYHALINALSAHMIQINLNTIFLTVVEQLPKL